VGVRFLRRLPGGTEECLCLFRSLVDGNFAIPTIPRIFFLFFFLSHGNAGSFRGFILRTGMSVAAALTLEFPVSGWSGKTHLIWGFSAVAGISGRRARRVRRIPKDAGTDVVERRFFRAALDGRIRRTIGRSSCGATPRSSGADTRMGGAPRRPFLSDSICRRKQAGEGVHTRGAVRRRIPVSRMGATCRD